MVASAVNMIVEKDNIKQVFYKLVVREDRITVFNPCANIYIRCSHIRIITSQVNK